MMRKRPRYSVAEGLHAALYRAYPRWFRDRFGAEMTVDFEDRYHDARTTGGALAAMRVVLSDIVDVASNAPPLWVEVSREDGGRAAAYSLMLAGVPFMVLVRLLIDPPSAVERWDGLAGLAVHCVIASAFAIATGRNARVVLTIALVTTAALVVWSMRANAGTLEGALVSGALIALPVWFVLLLVHLAPMWPTAAISARRKR